MDDEALFVQIARQSHYHQATAQAVFARVNAQLRVHGLQRTRYYVFRTVGSGESHIAPEPAERRPPRTLLVFPSADTALSFSQQQRLATAPPLMALSLGRILATLLNRPSIGSVLFTEEEIAVAIGQYPDGVRIDRAQLQADLAADVL